MTTDPIQSQNPSAVKRPSLIERLMAFENTTANEESDLLWEAIDAISGMAGRIVILERMLDRELAASAAHEAPDVAELIPVAPASAGEFIKALERLFSAIDGDGFVSNARDAGAAVVDLRRIWKAPTNGGMDV
jgi:hypothetical protein